MSLLALTIVLVLAGGLSLWVSGLLLGSRGGRGTPASALEQAALVRNRNALRESLLQAQGRLANLEKELAGERGARRTADEELARAETEMERAASELGRAEAELSQASLEISRLEARLEATTRELADTPTLPPDPPGRGASPSGAPVPGPVPPQPGKAGAKMTMAIGFSRESVTPVSAATDSALADLDLERVAHAKTRQALDAAQARLEALDRERHAPPPPVPRPSSKGYAESGRPAGSPPANPRDRKGAGFQTVSIASRDSDPPGVGSDRQRRAEELFETEHAEILARLSEIEEQTEPEK
jgi:hypothetical protein